MNFKKILLSSTIAAASLGFFACGDDSSSGGDISKPDTPPGPEIDTPKPTALSPVIFSGLSFVPMTVGTGMGGALSGMIKLDPEFANTEIPYTPEAVTLIDSVSFAVGRIVNGKAYQEKISINPDGVVFPTERVSFSQKTFAYSELSGCGDFRLYIFAYSSTKETDLKTSTYISVDSTLLFTRPEQDCQEQLPPSSSSPVVTPCDPVTPHPATLSNSLGTSQTAINFETGLADNPHVTLKIAGEEASFIPSAGVTIYEDNAQMTSVEAEPKAGQTSICREDFVKSNFMYDEELSSGIWLDVIDATGKIYPVLIKKAVFESATKGSVEILYYN